MKRYKVRIKKLEKELDQRANLKYCPKCGVKKDKSEFKKDSSRRDGLDGWCKECRSNAEKEARRKKTVQPQKTRKYPCTTKEFYDSYYSKDWIKEYIERQAAMKTKNKELRLDLQQEAWIRLSFCPEDMNDETTEEIIEKAIAQAYYKQWIKKNYEVSAIERMTRDEYAMWMSGVYIP